MSKLIIVSTKFIFSSSIYIHLCVCTIEHNIKHEKSYLLVNADYFVTVHAAVKSSKATVYRTVVQHFEFNVVNAGFTFQCAAPFRKNCEHNHCFASVRSRGFYMIRNSDAFFKHVSKQLVVRSHCFFFFSFAFVCLESAYVVIFSVDYVLECFFNST